MPSATRCRAQSGRAVARHNAEHTAIIDEFGLAGIVGADEPSGVFRAIFALLGALVAAFSGSVHLVIENAARALCAAAML